MQSLAGRSSIFVLTHFCYFLRKKITIKELCTNHSFDSFWIPKFIIHKEATINVDIVIPKPLRLPSFGVWMR